MLKVELTLQVLRGRVRYAPFPGFIYAFWLIDPQVFSWFQLLLERGLKTLVGINSERLEIEVKKGVATIPNSRVPF